jgi:hypothetical protein
MLLGAVLLGWLITQRGRSARRALEARGLIQQWERLLQRVGDNLVKFEDEHALLLNQPGLMERFDETSTGPVVEKLERKAQSPREMAKTDPEGALKEATSLERGAPTRGAEVAARAPNRLKSTLSRSGRRLR